MKAKTAEKYQLISIILTIILGFFNPVAQAFNLPEQPAASPAVSITKSVQIVQVVNSPAAPKVLSAPEESSSGRTVFSCSEPQSFVYSLVQGQAGINLNQPASCFRLSVGQPSALPKLSVTEGLKSNSRVVVQVLPSVFFVAFHFHPLKPLEGSPAQVPAVAAFLVALFVFSYRATNAKNKFRQFIISKIAPPGLLVMRC
ncbi:MAG: hypothetical protein HY918_01765 [Candidatus Doudnabacteria bacterium]|nr:hypothetical protein [Candidatus Doudnabacteria bacterium]